MLQIIGNIKKVTRQKNVTNLHAVNETLLDTRLNIYGNFSLADINL